MFSLLNQDQGRFALFYILNWVFGLFFFGGGGVGFTANLLQKKKNCKRDKNMCVCFKFDY